MRRFTLSLLALALVSVTVVIGHSQIRASQDRPTTAACVPNSAASVEDTRGVQTDILGRGNPAPVSPYTLRLSRSTFLAGAVMPDQCRLGAVVLSLEKGELDLTVQEGTAVLTPADPTQRTSSDCGTSCELTLPTTLSLSAGDTVYLENARYSLSNPADVDTIVWGSGLIQEDLPCHGGGC